jgi:hypothetical protein
VDWGNAFKSAWNGASQVAKAGAVALVTGARRVESAAWHGAKRLARDVVATRDLAQMWAGKMEVRARDWATETGKTIARGLVKTALGKLEHKAVKWTNRYNKIKLLFAAKEPKNAVQACPLAPKNPVSGNDSNFDGALFGRACVPVTPGGCKPTQDKIKEAKEKGYKSDSRCCENKRRERKAAGMPDRTIFHVNGITTQLKSYIDKKGKYHMGFCDQLQNIANSTCATVVGVYNATEVPPPEENPSKEADAVRKAAIAEVLGTGKDLLQTAEDQRLIEGAAAGRRIPDSDGRNPAVDTLTEVIVQEARSGNNNGTEISGHSQGGAIASLAFYQARQVWSDEGRGPQLPRFKVKSFGSAAPLWDDGQAYEHYVHVNDLTPVDFGLGDSPAGDKKRAGTDARVIRFSGNPANSSLRSVVSINGEQVQPPEDIAVRLDKDKLPSRDANHKMVETYLEMQNRMEKGCLHAQ